MPSTAVQQPQDATSKPLVVHLTVAATALGIGQRTAYERAKTGELFPGIPVLKTPRRVSVPVHALESVLGPLDDFLADQGLMDATA